MAVPGLTKDNPDYDPYPTPVDYSEAFLFQADNNKTVAVSLINSQKFGLRQAAIDREMQLAMNTELGFEKLDAKLQESSLEYRKRMTALENRHEERMAAADGDIPSPEIR